MLKRVDLLVCGAGPVGCVVAERAARVLGWNVLVVERRPHIAGNCFDETHPSGVLVHRYGPHYFRTNSRRILDYLSNFTRWIPGNYVVKSRSRGRLFDFPINLNTLEEFFGTRLDETSGRALLDRLRAPITAPANSEEFVLSRVGRELYEAFYLGYTTKQWGLSPRELAPSVCGRVPVRLTRDHRYVDHRFQATPAAGFANLFANMLDHPRIDVQLGVDFRDVRRAVQPRRATVYSGPIDEYFDYRHGPLPYRSLSFEARTYDEEYRQPCVQINYSDESDYTRSVEYKHVTGQKHPKTVVVFERSSAEGEPFYPIPREENHLLCEKYRRLALVETRQRRVYFCGRLATYRYLNTDEVIASALSTFHRIRTACRGLAAHARRGAPHRGRRSRPHRHARASSSIAPHFFAANSPDRAV